MKIQLLILTILFSLPLLPACAPPETERDRPNIVLISIDNLGANHMGCYGYDRPITPFMDSLAAGGALFMNPVAQDTWTLPSHASMLSSRFVSAHGVSHFEIAFPEDNPVLLQEALKKEGYTTAAFTTCLYISSTYGFDRGFDHFDYEYLPAQEVTRKAVDYLSTQGAEPFFLFLHYYDVHVPFDEKNPYGEQYSEGNTEELTEVIRRIKQFNGKKVSDITPEEIEWVQSVFHFDDVEYHLTQEGNPDKVISKVQTFNLFSFYLQNVNPQALDSLRGAYDNGVANMDLRLSQLFARLKKLPFFDNTLFVITSDHGEAFNQHAGVLGHGGIPFQELAKVPLIITGPSVPEGRRIQCPVAAGIDIAPTVMEYAGLSVHDSFQGRSLIPLIQGKTDRRRVIISGSEGSGRFAIQRGKWKLINCTSADSLCLYDLDADEGETRDLAEEHSDIYEELTRDFQRVEEINRKAGSKLKRTRCVLDDESRALLRELGYLE